MFVMCISASGLRTAKLKNQEQFASVPELCISPPVGPGQRPGWRHQAWPPEASEFDIFIQLKTLCVRGHCDQQGGQFIICFMSNMATLFIFVYYLYHYSNTLK